MPVFSANRIDSRHHSSVDEFDDIVELLLDYRCNDNEATMQLINCIARACMDNNHLWQDMGLPDRDTLTHLMRTYFPTLAAKNTDNMKWKKFFYRQLCERADIFICKSPSCGACADYNQCFESDSQPA